MKMSGRSGLIVGLSVLCASAAPTSAISATPRLAFEANLQRTIAIKGHESERYTLRDRMAHYKVPGVSIAVIDHCQLVDAAAFGLDAVNGKPVSRSTLFQAASLSKPLVAVAALKLVDQGKLTLDGDITGSLRSWTLPQSELTAGHAVTLRKLLNHTAGINEDNYEGYAAGQMVPTWPAILAGLTPANSAAIRVVKTPGSDWMYSGPGYLVSQTLMTDVTDTAFPTLMDDLVLRDVGMRDSSFVQPLPARMARRAARGAGPDGTPLPGGWHTYPELAAAGLWTTPADYARFGIALTQAIRGENQRLLGSASAQELMKRGLGNWGLGVDLGPVGSARQFGHTGSNAGFKSAFIMYPDTCQGAVVMTNAYEGDWLATETLRAVGDTYGWPDRKASPVRPAVELTPAIAELFVGNYHLRDFATERFAITRTSAGLYWARAGHVGRDLLPESDKRVFSPDSRMSIEASQITGGQAKTLEVSFGGGVNIAERD